MFYGSFSPGQNILAVFNRSLLLWVVLSLRLRSEYSLLEFSGLHYCLFVKVHLRRRLKNTDVRLSYNIRKIFECQLIPEIFFNFFHKFFQAMRILYKQSKPPPQEATWLIARGNRIVNQEVAMKGKEKCRVLKEIRQKIAEENDIAYVVSECRHQGDCRGTCPRCEAELRYLETQLKIRENLGKAITVAGLAITMPALTACDFPSYYGNETEGATTISIESELPSDEDEENPVDSDPEILPELLGDTSPYPAEGIPDSPESSEEEEFGYDIEGDFSTTPPLQ